MMKYYSLPRKIIQRTVNEIMTASLKLLFHSSLLITRTTVLKSNTKPHYRWKYQEVGNCVNRPSKRISLSRTRSILTSDTGEWERQLSITWSFSNVGTPLCERVLSTRARSVPLWEPYVCIDTTLRYVRSSPLDVVFWG